MPSIIVANAISKALRWLAPRPSTVSKHIQAHARHVINAARNRPWYLERAFGRHGVFRTPNVKKFLESALKNPSNTVLQHNGRVLVEKEFNRAIGRTGERIIRIIIDPRTGRIVTAFPVSSFASGSLGAIAFGIFDERFEETLKGVELIARHWQSKTQAQEERSSTVLSWIINFLVDPGIAGTFNEDMKVDIHHYLKKQGQTIIREIEYESQMTLSRSTRDAFKKELRAAIAGALPQ